MQIGLPIPDAKRKGEKRRKMIQCVLSVVSRMILPRRDVKPAGHEADSHSDLQVKLRGWKEK
jgi:hypothetical protein